MRKMNKNIQEKWVSGLLAIKQELETKEINSLTKLFRIYKLYHNWRTWLLKNNVIIRKENRYYWNEKIPVSIKLINKYRLDEKNKIKKTKVNFKTNNNSIKKVASPKIKNKPIQTNKDEVGIIRKFLKWLW